ncbi:MAG: competence/damage-inducible protein A, partial [Clostridioides sp.]|nr:competence/damage-inducible protein A [Clostridioides sp.]
MNAEIISVGTELLLGNILNTNARYISKELAKVGVEIYRQTTVGDNEKRLFETIKKSLESCDIVITTG